MSAATRNLFSNDSKRPILIIDSAISVNVDDFNMHFRNHFYVLN